MDSKLDSNKDEKSNVTENDASKAKTNRIKLFVGMIAVAIALLQRSLLHLLTDHSVMMW